MKYLSLLLLALLLAGCAQRYTLTRHSYPSDFEEVNLQCFGTVNHVWLRDGTVINTERLALARDSAAWILPDGTRQKIRLWDIARIDNTNHRRGAKSGAFVGVLAGLGGGLAISSQIHAHGTLGEVGVAALSGACSAVGGLLGATIGSAIGYPTVIKFDSTITSPADTMRRPTHNAKGWAMPEDSTNKH